jgi:H+/gluconate symporter-like permease
MGGFTGFVATWFFVFLLGSVFGKVMEDSGAADSVAQWVVQRFGAGHALVAIVGACALLTYGGVSLFIVAFSVFPLALALFRQAGLPRRFIPAAIGFGSVTFTMTSAGSPEIQNWIPMEHLGTTPYAAWQVSLAVAVSMAVFSFAWLNWMVRRAVAAGGLDSLPHNGYVVTTIRDVCCETHRSAYWPMFCLTAVVPLLGVLLALLLFSI